MKAFIADHGSFPFDVLVCIGHTDEQVYKLLKKSGVNLDAEGRQALKCEGEGRTVMLPGGQTVLRVRPNKNKARFYAHLAHEIFHAVEFLFSRVGIVHDMEKSGEAFAYQIGHLTEQIYAKLKLTPAANLAPTAASHEV